MSADVKPEYVKNDVPKPILKGEGFCKAKTQDTSKDCVQSENTQNDGSSQMLMDCAPGSKESVTTSSGSEAAQFSSWQTSKRSISPGSHPVKTTCVAPHSPNSKLALCLSDSPRKGVSTQSDIEMLSPSSPVSKNTLANNSSDKDHDSSTCAEDSSFAVPQEMASQQFLRDSDSGCSLKDRGRLISMELEDAEVADCSHSSGICQDLIESQSHVIFERYLSICLLLRVLLLCFSCIVNHLSCHRSTIQVLKL